MMASLMVVSSSRSRGRHGRQRTGVVLARPFLVLVERVDVEPAAHARVAEAAELRARYLVLTRLGDLEPGRDVVAGNGVLLEARLRDEEAVDHVARLELDTDRLPDRHVQIVVHG